MLFVQFDKVNMSTFLEASFITVPPPASILFPVPAAPIPSLASPRVPTVQVPVTTS